MGKLIMYYSARSIVMDQMKVDLMGGTCSTYEREERCVEIVGKKFWMEDLAWKSWVNLRESYQDDYSE
jgi:hypothetical protein